MELNTVICQTHQTVFVQRSYPVFIKHTMSDLHPVMVHPLVTKVIKINSSSTQVFDVFNRVHATIPTAWEMKREFSLKKKLPLLMEK